MRSVPGSGFPVCGLRRDRRLYLRLRGRGRRHDDALLLTSVLGYELKTAVGTSVFIMTFTALTGAASHFAIGGAPDIWCLIFCVLSTLLWALDSGQICQQGQPAVLNRATRRYPCASWYRHAGRQLFVITDSGTGLVSL